MLNVIVLIMFSVCIMMALAGATLCYHGRSGWQWFLLASVVMFCSTSGFFMSIELMKMMDIDWSKIIKPPVAVESVK